MDEKPKTKALELAIASVQKEFGDGAIMRLKDGEKIGGDVQVVPTGSMGLDIALGIGGYPRGRIVEIYGPESSGKTTLTLHAIANVQKQGGVAAFIDAEHALDITYAKKLGVKTDELLISQPDFGEQALEITDMLVRSGAVDLIVIDSVAALVPKAEIEGDMGDSHVGLQARLMSQALRKKFYASQRLDIRRIGAIKESLTPGKDPVAIGNRTRVKVVKNKLAAPFREVEFDILYGQGISRSGEIIDLASDLNIIQKSGAWFSVDGERIGQGRDNARTYLEAHPELMERIEKKLLLHHGIGSGGAAPAVNAPGSPGSTGSGGPVVKPPGKGEAAGHAAAPDPSGPVNNAKRGNVRPS